MSNTDLQFFTNEDGRELANRFERIFTKTQNLDALVGYFRTSGFFKLYQPWHNTVLFKHTRSQKQQLFLH